MRLRVACDYHVASGSPPRQIVVKFIRLVHRTAQYVAPTVAEIMLCATVALAGSGFAAGQQPVVRTANPITRGFQETDFPRTVKVADNVYTYEDFHAGPEKFTTTDMFVVTSDGVLVADGQGSVEETKRLVEAIAKVTPKPI